MQLGVNAPDLSRMFGDNSIIGGQLGVRQYDQAMDNGMLNQASALQDLFQKEATNPLEVRQKQLANETTAAQLPGVAAEASLSEDKAALSRKTMPLQLDSKQRELLTKMSEDEVKGIALFAQKLAYSPNPEKRKQGLEMMQFSRAIQEERAKIAAQTAGRLKEIGAQGANAQELMRMQIEAGRFKKGTGGGATSIEDALKSGKMDFEKAAVAYFVLAQDTEDPEQKQMYLEKAAAMEKAGLARAGAAAAAVQRPDLPALNIPAVGGGVPNPTLGGTPAKPAQAPMYARNPKTGERIMSTDGGQTWNKAQ